MGLGFERFSNTPLLLDGLSHAVLKVRPAVGVKYCYEFRNVFCVDYGLKLGTLGSRVVLDRPRKASTKGAFDSSLPVALS